VESMELLLDRLGKSRTNDEFLSNLQEAPARR
jgi:transcription termination factor Rho